MKGSPLYDAAEHALVEMRDRFDLKRGDSVSLDALEDVLIGSDQLRQAAAQVVNAATGSGEQGFARVPHEMLWNLIGALEASRGY